MHSVMYTKVQMHSGVVSSEQSPRKTICDLKCKLTANQNVFVYMRLYFSDLQWCSMVSHESGYHHEKNRVCNNYRARQLREILRNRSTHNCDDDSYMGMELKN